MNVDPAHTDVPAPAHRRRLLPAVLALVALGGLAAALREAPEAAVRAAPVPAMQLGMNLGSLDYWDATLPFADLVANTGTLVLTEGSWPQLNGPDSPVPLDASGRPRPVRAGTPLGTILELDAPPVPTGDYACRVSAGWRVTPFADGWALRNGPDRDGRFTMRVSDPKPKVGLVIMTVAARDGARLDTLSCRMPGVAGDELFNPVFLAEQRPFRVLRFMDWMRTNVEGHRSWATRTTSASFTQGGKAGVSAEYMVELANRLGVDPWFTLPFDADPDYYTRFAEYVRDHLAPGRRAYVELSNEVWNDQFPQAKLAQKLGKERYPASNPDEAGDFYYADRVRAVMDEWTRVFGSAAAERLVRVLGTQSGWNGRIERTVGHGGVAGHVDALATAPYFGNDGSRYPGTGAARIDALFADGPRTVGEAIRQAVDARAIARRHGLRYVAYEGGPGYASYVAAVQPDLLAAHDDPRMEQLYRLFLSRWKAEVGDLFMPFTSVHKGSFGHRRYTGQSLTEAPAARALLDARWGARIGAEK